MGGLSYAKHTINYGRANVCNKQRVFNHLTFVTGDILKQVMVVLLLGLLWYFYIYSMKVNTAQKPVTTMLT